MKIVQLSGNYSLNGGVGTYVFRLTQKLTSAGHQVSVIHSDTRLPLPTGDRASLFYVNRFDAFTSPDESSRLAAEVMATLKKIGPDVVHVQSNNNFLLENQIRREFPVVKSIHVYDFCPAGTKYHHALGKNCGHSTGPLCIPRMLYKRCTENKNPLTLLNFYKQSRAVQKNDSSQPVILVASEFVRQQALQSGYAPQQVQVLPYFTDIPEGSTDLALSADEKIILASGRMVPEKGLDRLLYAVSYITDIAGWKLVLDGEGADKPQLMKLSRKLRLDERVEFAGWLNPEKHWEMFRRSYMAAVPSIWPEPFGLVGIEAMSYSKPVVAFRSGGIPEWLEDGKTGFLVETGNARGMAEKIKQLLGDPMLAKTMGEAGKKRVENFYHSSGHVEKLLQVYQQAIDGNLNSNQKI